MRVHVDESHSAHAMDTVVQPGAVELVLCGHRMHPSYMHRESKNLVVK